MMAKWIRVMALGLAILLLLPILSFAETDAEPAIDKLKDKLLSDFFDFMYAQEMVNTDVLWAESYFEQYDSARSWDQLLIARAAANAAWMDISGRELPEQSMSTDDYYNLLLNNVDASFMENSAEEFRSSRTLLQNCLVNMMNYLADNVFESHGWENSVKHAELTRECVEYNLQYCARTVDWLLLEIDDKARAEHFSDFLKEHCPAIASRREEGVTEQAVLEESAGKILDNTEALNNAMSELTGQIMADLILYAEAVESGSVTEGMGEILTIDGLPLTLPYPTWEEDLLTQSITYYWKDGDAPMRLAAVGEPIDTPPNGCVVRTPEVSRDELENYIEYLDSLGMACMNRKEDDDVLTVYYKFGGSTFAFESKENALTLYMLEKPVCFAPVWYINRG